MAEVTTVFWDVGGVLLTNGWDQAARRRVVENFNLEWEDFERRHEGIVAPFETRLVTLEEYLEETVFYRSRPFTQNEFRKFMAAQSQPCRKALRIAEELAGRGRYLMATINNESLELNQYRIEKFELRKYFSIFFSSCFLGVRKPGEEIYRLALQMTQRVPEECVFIDDRPENLTYPRATGVHAIQYHSPAQLRDELAHRGVEIDHP